MKHALQRRADLLCPSGPNGIPYINGFIGVLRLKRYIVLMLLVCMIVGGLPIS